MRAVVMISLGLLFSITATAQTAQQLERERRQFEERAKSLGETVSADKPQETARCRELRQELERYRRKPQRSFTARRNYEAECVREEFNREADNTAPFLQ